MTVIVCVCVMCDVCVCVCVCVCEVIPVKCSEWFGKCSITVVDIEDLV